MTSSSLLPRNCACWRRFAHELRRGHDLQSAQTKGLQNAGAELVRVTAHRAASDGVACGHVRGSMTLEPVAAPQAGQPVPLQCDAAAAELAGGTDPTSSGGECGKAGRDSQRDARRVSHRS